METTERKVNLRPVTAEDDEFLYTVYSSTRRDEVAAFGWDQAQQDAFLRMQFMMQHRSYNMQYPHAEHSIILVDETPAGRIIIDRAVDNITLTDIAILPEFRKNGVATQLIRQLQDEAAAQAQPVVLHVDRANMAAFNLYEKLGFTVIGETELMFEMKWVPSPA